MDKNNFDDVDYVPMVSRSDMYGKKGLPDYILEAAYKANSTIYGHKVVKNAMGKLELSTN